MSVPAAVFAAYFPIPLLFLADPHVCCNLESIITHFYSLPAGLLLEALVSVIPERGEWAGNSSGELGWLLYLSSIFNALQSVLMTLDNRFISVHSVILSLAHSSHTSRPSPKLHPYASSDHMLSFSGKSQFQIFCPVAKSNVRPYASYFLWENMLT